MKRGGFPSRGEKIRKEGVSTYRWEKFLNGDLRIFLSL